MKCFLSGIMILGFLEGMGQTAQRYDIVISEIMADPSPPVSLPNAEFLELKNISSIPYNLNGYTVSDGVSVARIGLDYILKPDSFVVICTTGAYPSLSKFGSAIAVSNFPSLDNEGDLIFLISPDGVLIHAIEYKNTWYGNELKSEGGWSLEMIDSHDPCGAISNWKASTDNKGGTPGQRNSVEGINLDEQGPALIRAFAPDSLQVILYFDEPLDSASSMNAAAYSMNNGLGYPSRIIAIGPLFNRVLLEWQMALKPEITYTITVKAVNDCRGNSIGALNSCQVGLASPADSFDLVVNEILFNPRFDGLDYVEIYNRGHHPVNLKGCNIANRNSLGLISSIRPMSGDDQLFFPGDYLVLTESRRVLEQQFQLSDPSTCKEISSMPSFPDDTGTVVLLNTQGEIIDELSYNEKWHFPLISNREGIALERIDFNNPTQDSGNWHSAASDAGYGTPGRQNSQFRQHSPVKGEITISPEIFSPDNDGYDDFLIIRYHFPEPGYTSNIRIFDANGRQVRSLVRNGLCGTEGFFRWDGLDEFQQKLNLGIYIILSDIFDLKGKTKKFKQVVVLARRF